MEHLWDRLVQIIASWFGRPAAPRAVPPLKKRPTTPPSTCLQLEALETRKLPSATTGLTAQYYRDPNFTQLALTRTEPTINLNLNPGQPPAPGLPSTHYAVRWSGQVQASKSENYTFSTISDDGVRLIVNGKTLINDWNDHAAKQDNAVLPLVAGQKYNIEVDYYQNTGYATAQLYWSSAHTARQIVPSSALTPTVAVSATTGLTAQYYRDPNFTQLALTRTEPTINLNLSPGQPPAPGLPSTRYAVRWSGQVQASKSENYTFSTISDDGVRLIVNGKTLINDWNDHAAKQDNAVLPLVAGQKYNIEVDYYQNTGYATAQLYWSSAHTARQIVPSSALTPTVAVSPGAAPPVAILSVANVISPGATSYTFRVVYKDDVAVDVSSIGSTDLRITGPNGFSQLATLVGVDNHTNGMVRTAVYRFTPPGGSWSSGGNGTYTVTLQANQIKDTQGHFTPTAVLGKFQVNIPATDWFAQHLHDPGIMGTARGLYNSDHNLSRNDMIALFSQVERDNVVTATELSDLRTLVGNPTAVGMADYVRNLTNKVVNGDFANQHYLGHWLGNLTAGYTGGTLKNLVNKWFLGWDHPGVPNGVSYLQAKGSLFGFGPTYTDIQQGHAADCYLLAGLGETVSRSANAIRGMFIDNGDGTFTVRFYHNGAAEYVTVDKYLPASASGGFLYANMPASLNDPNNKLWVPLAEKAYAQLAESGWSRTSSANAYSTLDLGNETDAIHQLTGRSEVSQALFGNTATFSAIVGAFNTGHLVGLDTNGFTATGIVPDHVYVMLGYNSASHLFTLYNPWGYVQQLTWNQVAANFGAWSENVT